MDQLTCGVDETLWINGVRVQVLEVRSDVVTLGLALPGRQLGMHQIALPASPPPAETVGSPRCSSTSAAR